MEVRRGSDKPSNTGESKKPYQPLLVETSMLKRLKPIRGFIVRITVPAAVIGLAISGIYSVVTRNFMRLSRNGSEILAGWLG
jgi:hypothetical protein